jgi:TIR domain
MKVFISWSGTVSEKVASALRDWLPSVIQSIEPYVSSQDIDKGARWSSDIGKELEASDFGILCITPANAEAPWIQFEAGALSKSVETSHVVPFLFGLGPAQLPQGPLVQFQAVRAVKADVKRLVHSLNNAGDDRPLGEGRLSEVFEVWWPRLEETLGTIDADKPACQRPSVSPQLRPSVLPTGGHVFSPLVAIGSPHYVGARPSSRSRAREGEAERRWPRREPSGQGHHPLAGGCLGEPVAVGVVGDEHVGVVE